MHNSILLERGLVWIAVAVTLKKKEKNTKDTTR